MNLTGFLLSCLFSVLTGLAIAMVGTSLNEGAVGISGALLLTVGVISCWIAAGCLNLNIYFEPPEGGE